MGTCKYSTEFRADAVALARSSGRLVSSVAAELGVNHESPGSQSSAGSASTTTVAGTPRSATSRR
ncbi:transposase [Streptomyces mirabilis]|uniref:transposase n=1 Tax=Streptomyces mirabilis TaxID=68239 RepID=UPI003824509D